MLILFTVIVLLWPSTEPARLDDVGLAAESLGTDALCGVCFLGPPYCLHHGLIVLPSFSDLLCSKVS